MDPNGKAPSSIDQTADVMGQAYIVVAEIAQAAGIFDAPSVQHALDYFSKCEYREDFLPFSASGNGSKKTPK